MQKKQYICQFDRRVLYNEEEEPKACEDHPDGPVDSQYVSLGNANVANVVLGV